VVSTRMTACLALVLGVAAGAARHQGPPAARPKLLLLRGGVLPIGISEADVTEEADAVVEEKLILDEEEPISSITPVVRRNRPRVSSVRSTVRKPALRASWLRDAAAATLCLAVVGTALTTNFDDMIRVIAAGSQGKQSMAWLLLGGILPVGLYYLVRLTNHYRAVGLCQTLFGVDLTSPDSKEFARMLPAVLFGLGAAASMQSLPAAAG